jgi:predicted dienelactone hydrolase
MRAVRLGRNGFTRLLTRATVCFGIYSVAWPARALAQDVLQATPYPVGMTQLEYIDPSEGGRPLDLMLIYPAAPATIAVPFKIFMGANLHLYKDAPVVSDGLKRPLVMFSHGAGGNGSIYAWFGEYLASHGYLVAMVYHFRANTYDSSALYVRNRIWQRPRDIGLDITNLLEDRAWGPHIDPGQIGVAGHSQGDLRRSGSEAPK